MHIFSIIAHIIDLLFIHIQHVDFTIEEGYEEGCEQGFKYVTDEFEKEDYFLELLQGSANSSTGNLRDMT